MRQESPKTLNLPVTSHLHRKDVERVVVNTGFVKVVWSDHSSSYYTYDVANVNNKV